MKLRVLLLGNGGREHVLAWKLAQSSSVECIHVVPGNGGTAGVVKCTNIPSVSPSDFAAICAHATSHALNFLLPGPEAPLVAGIADYFARHAPHIPCFGPSAAAARLEGSKTFAKDFMARHSIPTARYANFSVYDEAREHVERVAYRVVIKAAGLAGGKGVVLPESKAEAVEVLRAMMLRKEFGEAGDEVVVEELLEGDEISILSLCDGTTIRSLPPAQDHKRIGDNDAGPNTGGMGSYAPSPLVSPQQLALIDHAVLQPTVAGMRAEGYPMRGCLFTGLMLTAAGPRVLEYNVRFGDPEAQSVLPLLQSDLAELLSACCSGTLAQHRLALAPGFAATVVLAARGYPGGYETGRAIALGPLAHGTYVFHAGTRLGADGAVATSGGRVLAATATGATLRAAVDGAYEGVRSVRFAGMQYRSDIARRALA